MRKLGHTPESSAKATGRRHANPLVRQPRTHSGKENHRRNLPRSRSWNVRATPPDGLAAAARKSLISGFDANLPTHRLPGAPFWSQSTIWRFICPERIRSTPRCLRQTLGTEATAILQHASQPAKPDCWMDGLLSPEIGRSALLEHSREAQRSAGPVETTESCVRRRSHQASGATSFSRSAEHVYPTNVARPYSKPTLVSH